MMPGIKAVEVDVQEMPVAHFFINALGDMRLTFIYYARALTAERNDIAINNEDPRTAHTIANLYEIMVMQRLGRQERLIIKQLTDRENRLVVREINSIENLDK